MYKILIVDDEAEIRRLFTEFFKRSGYEVVSAESALLGLNILGAGEFDVLISDIHMPFMDGIEFCRRAKRMSPDLVIVLLTGFGSLETAQKAIKIGVSEYLTKPVDLLKLKESVEEGLKQIQEKKGRVQYYAETEAAAKKERDNLELLKNDLMGLIGHELSTPISIMSGSFELLKDAAKSPDGTSTDGMSEGKKAELSHMFNRGQRWIVGVTESVNYYLDLSRGETALNKEEVLLNDFLEANFSNLSYIASQNKAILVKEIAPVSLRASIDKEKILDVLCRLILNSGLHNPAGTQIFLRLYPLPTKKPALTPGAVP